MKPEIDSTDVVIFTDPWHRYDLSPRPTQALKNQLWTTKYAPKTLKEICGNKSNVEKISQWLEEW